MTPYKEVNFLEVSIEITVEVSSEISMEVSRTFLFRDWPRLPKPPITRGVAGIRVFAFYTSIRNPFKERNNFATHKLGIKEFAFFSLLVAISSSIPAEEDSTVKRSQD